MELIQRGLALVTRNQPVEARAALSTALGTSGLAAADAAQVRSTLAQLSERLVFSPEILEGDPHAMPYVVQGGDSLARIAKRLSVQVDWRFIQRINRLGDANLIKPGQRIKIVTGPFHAIIDKAAKRMDLFLGDEGDLVYVRSYPVGLGQFNSTPVGLFRVRVGSKLVDPEWVNPRTRQRFAADDPANPIGERWIGLEGTDEATSGLQGYGIHGTIEPESIGGEASMGCVRMLADDVALVYEILTEGVSMVRIVDGRSD
jgi:lipoprotein-anchoring transpeptidase ErfK/SrfK